MEEDELEVKFLDQEEYYDTIYGVPTNELVVYYPEDFEKSGNWVSQRK